MIVCIKKILNSEDLSISMILVSLVFYIPTMLLKVSDKMRPLANKLCFVFVFAGFFFFGGGGVVLFCIFFLVEGPKNLISRRKTRKLMLKKMFLLVYMLAIY